MFGNLVAQLTADLTQYEKDLNRAEQMYKAHLQRLRQQSLGAGFGGSGGGGGGGGGGVGGFSHIGSQGSIDRNERAAETAERRFRRIMASGEADLRRFYGSWDNAIKDNVRQDQEAEQKRVRASRAAMEGRLNDIKQVGALKRFLDADDEKLAKEEIRRNRQTNQEKLNDLKQIQVFEKYLADERIKSEKQLADAQKRMKEASHSFFQSQAGNLPGIGSGNIGGAGNFLAPAGMRGLDEVNGKWLKQQQLIAAAGGVSGVLQKRLDDIGRTQLRKMNEGMQGFVNSLKFITIGGAAGILSGLIGAGIQMNRNFQQQRMTLATILGISDKITDSRGKEVDASTALNLNLKEAEKLYGHIRKESAGSILTGQELFTSVSANFGLGRRAGLSSNQIVQVTKLITQLAKTQGIQGEGMLAQETRALFTGEGLESATVARMLGINKKSQIQNAIDKGNNSKGESVFFDFIQNKLRTGLPAIEAYAHSFDAFSTTLKTAFQDLTRLSFEKVFEKITARLGDFTKTITLAKVEEWAEKISDALVGAYDALERFAKSDGWKILQTVFRFIVENAGTLIQVFAAMKGAQMLTAGASAVRGLTGAGGLIAKTAPGLIPGLAGTANAFNIAGAGIVGYGIGTAFNNKFGGVREETQAAATELDLKRRYSPAFLRRLQLQRNIEHLESQLGRQRFVEGDVAGAGVTRRLIERNRTNLGITSDQVQKEQAGTSQSKFAERVAERLGLPSAGEMLRQSRRAPEIDLERRKAMNEERIAVAQQLAKLSDDKIGVLRTDAEAEKLQVQKNMKENDTSRKRGAALIRAIEVKLKNDIIEVREEERIAVGKKFAEMTGDQRKLLDLEYSDTLLNIKKMHLAKQDEIGLRLGAEYEYHKKARDFDTAAILERQKFISDATDNEVLQITNAANQAYVARREFLEKNVKDEKARNAELAKDYVLIQNQRNRKIVEFQNGLTRKALDLNRESQEFDNKVHKARLQMEKEILDAQKRQAKEGAELMRERIAAVKELTRAEQDRLRKLAEIGTGGKRIGGMLQIGGARGGALVNPLNRAAEKSIGLRGVDFGLASEAEKLFGSEELTGKLTDKFSKQTGNTQLAQAMAEQQVRELSGMAGQAGGTQNILGRLGELGIKTGGGFQERLQQIEGRGIEVANKRAGLERETGMTDLEREQQDVNLQVEEAKKRLTELDERQAEVLQSYKDTITNLHDQFDLQVKETASSLANLARQANEVAHALNANKVPIPAQSVPVIRRLGQFNPQKAQTEAEKLLAETGSFVFNEGAIKIDAGNMDPQQLLEAVTKAAQDLSRRTAPSRR